MSEASNSVCITGVGMVASLGCDFDHVCAAARAGLIRTQESDYPVMSPVTGEPIAVMVHAIPEATHGFQGDARRLRIMQAALADLKRRDPTAPWGKSETRFFLSVADPAREFRGAALVGDESSQAKMAEGEKQAAQTPYNFAAMAEMLHKSARLCDFGASPKLENISLAGHCGVAQCIAIASRKLLENEMQMAIVGGIDSLLEEKSLAWLERTGRLKSAALPVGLAPGEAGVFLVIEKSQHAQQRGIRPLAIIEVPKLAEDDKPLLSGESPMGVALSQLLLDCSQAAQWQGDAICWLVSDQNGEPYRAMEWGQALVRAIPKCPALNQPVVWYPAISFGDTYAACGAVAIASVLHAWKRGYAPAKNAVIVHSSDSSYRAATVLRRLL